MVVDAPVLARARPLCALVGVHALGAVGGGTEAAVADAAVRAKGVDASAVGAEVGESLKDNKVGKDFKSKSVCLGGITISMGVFS